MARRHHELLRELEFQGSATIDELATKLEVAEATVRRDLQRLSATGRIVRTYGGAQLPGRPRRPADDNAAAKAAIARAAAEQVTDGDTVMITGGTTTLALAHALADRQGLTVVTNSLQVTHLLVNRPAIQLVVLGGFARPQHDSLLGNLTAVCAREVRANRLFMGAKALHPRFGLMHDQAAEVSTDRVLRRAARQATVLVDATKFAAMAPNFVFGLEEVDRVVTDERVDEDVRTAVRAAGVELTIVALPTEVRA